MKEILNNIQFADQVKCLAQSIIQRHADLEHVFFIGIQQGGVVLGDELIRILQEAYPAKKIQYGQLDITFYRDDIRKEILAPDTMNIPFPVENRKVVLIDDVLFTGRTIKAALDVLLDYGRPEKVELCVLIDRKEHRQFPIQADYSGMQLTTNRSDKVKLVKDKSGMKHVVLYSS